MYVKIVSEDLKVKKIVETNMVRFSERENDSDAFVMILGSDPNPSRVRLDIGDRWFIMNDSGETIDSARVVEN